MVATQPEIGATLKRMRLERRWTQAALALRLGIAREYLRQIELDLETPSSELEQKIKAWLGDPNARLD